MLERIKFLCTMNIKTHFYGEKKQVDRELTEPTYMHYSFSIKLNYSLHFMNIFVFITILICSIYC